LGSLRDVFEGRLQFALSISVLTPFVGGHVRENSTNISRIPARTSLDLSQVLRDTRIRQSNVNEFERHISYRVPTWQPCHNREFVIMSRNRAPQRVDSPNPVRDTEYKTNNWHSLQKCSNEPECCRSGNISRTKVCPRKAKWNSHTTILELSLDDEEFGLNGAKDSRMSRSCRQDQRILQPTSFSWPQSTGSQKK
jgi:hypothetical protein